jgi:hypothetical protein
LLSQSLLLRLQLLVGELLQGHGVHRVFQGQLQDREGPNSVREAKQVPPTYDRLRFFFVILHNNKSTSASLLTADSKTVSW